jgi:hypothetical protein
MSTETNDSKKPAVTMGKKTRKTLASLASTAATLLAKADASTMDAARTILRAFDTWDGLTYAKWAETMAAADAAVLTASRVSQFRSAADMERIAGETLTSERQARDLRKALTDSGVDLDDTDAVRAAIAAAGGVSAMVANARKVREESKPKASKAAPKAKADEAEEGDEGDDEPTTPKSMDPAATLFDTVSAMIRAANGNRATLELMATTLEDFAKGIRKGLDVKTPTIGKATRKTPAAA